MKNDSPLDIIRGIKSLIELEKESGLDEMALKHAANQDLLSPGSSGPSAAEKQKALDELREAVLACKGCALCRSRRNAVFGEGDADAGLMFVGEAPGLQEDIQAKPFVGRAGTLLTKIIEAMGLTRQDVYIANCLKCRPPQNRNPLPAEIDACRSFFMEQIRIIAPEIICCLGKFAAQTVLMSEEPISRLRGKFYELEGIKVMPTFHPAYLLRNPKEKRLVWEDMKKIRDYLEIRGRDS